MENETINNDRNILSNKILFRDAAEQWIEYKKIYIKKSTYSNYNYIIKKHLLPFFGELDVEAITKGEIDKFISEKKSVKSGENSKGGSSKYIRDIYSVLKAVLIYCEETFSSNINIKHIVLPKVKKPEILVLKKQEYKGFGQYLKDNMCPANLAMLIVIYTGIRIGEVCGLKWSDFDEKEKIISINRTVQRVYEGEKTRIISGPPKTADSKRMIPLPDELAKIMIEYKGDENEYIVSGSDTIKEPGFLRRRFKKVIKNLGYDVKRFHDLRHSFATKCLQMNFDVQTLSEILGHSKASTTLNIYAHSSMDAKRKNMKKLSL